MLFLDDTNDAQPQQQFSLDVSQNAASIQRHILALCQKHKPEVIVAEGIEANYILENLPEIQPHCGAIALKQPTLENVSFEKLQQAFLQRGQQRFYNVIVMLSQDYPQFKQLSHLFYMIKPDANFEAEVEYLLNTYFLLGDATDTD